MGILLHPGEVARRSPLKARDNFWAARRSYPEWEGHSEDAPAAQSLKEYRLLDVLEEGPRPSAPCATTTTRWMLAWRVNSLNPLRRGNLDRIYDSLSWGQVFNGGDAHLEANNSKASRTTRNSSAH